ncbi:MAG: DUF5688 family protein [Eubacterium sp.]|nr:DUF5688 family protein [Eubacterium sp.]
MNYYRCISISSRLPEDFFKNYEDVRNNLRCRLIHAERNQRFLIDVPHRKWMDLAITCVYEIHEKDKPDCAIQIQNAHLRPWGIEPEQLIRDALQNSLKTKDILFQPLASFLESELDADSGELPDSPLYLLSNQSRPYGAAVIALPGMTERIAEKLECDYFIIPSSVHECLILPDDGNYSVSELNEMVRSINQTNVEEQDVLSDHVYIYKRPETGSFHPNK